MSMSLGGGLMATGAILVIVNRAAWAAVPIFIAGSVILLIGVILAFIADQFAEAVRTLVSIGAVGILVVGLAIIVMHDRELMGMVVISGGILMGGFALASCPDENSIRIPFIRTSVSRFWAIARCASVVAFFAAIGFLCLTIPHCLTPTVFQLRSEGQIVSNRSEVAYASLRKRGACLRGTVALNLAGASALMFLAGQRNIRGYRTSKQKRG